MTQRLPPKQGIEIRQLYLQSQLRLQEAQQRRRLVQQEQEIFSQDVYLHPGEIEDFEARIRHQEDLAQGAESAANEALAHIRSVMHQQLEAYPQHSCHRVTSRSSRYLPDLSVSMKVWIRAGFGVLRRDRSTAAPPLGQVHFDNVGRGRDAGQEPGMWEVEGVGSETSSQNEILFDHAEGSQSTLEAAFASDRSSHNSRSERGRAEVPAERRWSPMVSSARHQSRKHDRSAAPSVESNRKRRHYSEGGKQSIASLHSDDSQSISLYSVSTDRDSREPADDTKPDEEVKDHRRSVASTTDSEQDLPKVIQEAIHTEECHDGSCELS